MSDTVIAVENLSKRYLVEHKPGGKGYKNYTALRDFAALRHVPAVGDIDRLAREIAQPVSHDLFASISTSTAYAP
jgi:hypothetical protein